MAIEHRAQSIQLTRVQLTLIRRQLLSAHLHAEESEEQARKGGDGDLAERCHDIAEMLMNELSYVSMLTARLAREAGN
jgi:hypothetical protein